MLCVIALRHCLQNQTCMALEISIVHMKSFDTFKGSMHNIRNFCLLVRKAKPVLSRVLGTIIYGSQSPFKLIQIKYL